MQRWICVVVMATFCFACNGNGGSGSAKSYQPLDEQQKSEFKELTQSVARIQSVARDYMTKNQSSSSAALIMRTMSVASEAPEEGHLKRIIDEGNCEMDMPIDENSGELKIGDGGSGGQFQVPLIRFELKGEGCPIYLLMTLQGQQVGDSKFVGQFSWVYKAFSEEFKRESDVDDVAMKGQIQGSLSPVGNGQQMHMQVSVSGSGHSQQHGDFESAFIAEQTMTMILPDGLQPEFDFGIDIKGSGVNSYSVTTSKFDALLEEKTNIDGLVSVRQEFFLNKQQISQQEYAEYMQDTWFPGMGEVPGQDGGHQPGNGRVLCELTFYNGDQISTSELQSRIDNQQPISVFPLATFDGCMSNQHFGSFDSESVQVNYSEESGLWVADIQLLSGPRDRLYSVPDEWTDTAVSLGRYSLRWTCSPDRRCPSF